MMNVEFPYLYRDASNWKKFGRAVFANPEAVPLEKAQARLIAASEHPYADIHWFIPERVGLEPLREGWDIDLDGPWHELSGDLSQTDDRPTDPRTLLEFVQDFEQAAVEDWLHVQARVVT
jgi:hypothetical protein